MGRGERPRGEPTTGSQAKTRAERRRTTEQQPGPTKHQARPSHQGNKPNSLFTPEQREHSGEGGTKKATATTCITALNHPRIKSVRRTGIMEGWQTTKRRKTNSTQNEPKGPEGREGTVENLNRTSRKNGEPGVTVDFSFCLTGSTLNIHVGN